MELRCSGPAAISKRFGARFFPVPVGGFEARPPAGAADTATNTRAEAYTLKDAKDERSGSFGRFQIRPTRR